MSNKSFTPKPVLRVLVGVAILVQSAGAAEFSFDIPQLLGHYLGDMYASPSIDLQVDLRMDFAQIESASLQLAGTQTPGLAGDLNSPYTFPLSAEIIAWSDRPGWYGDVIIDALLPNRDGAFVFDEEFHTLHPAGGLPDFSPWLDGGAEFQFSVHTPPMLAIYYLINMPSVTITSATLVIQGEPNPDEFMLRGDFDSNGTVDGQDLLAWQRNSGVGSLSDWQAGYGAESVGASIAVPEPAAVALLACGLCCSFLRRDFHKS